MGNCISSYNIKRANLNNNITKYISFNNIESNNVLNDYINLIGIPEIFNKSYAFWDKIALNKLNNIYSNFESIIVYNNFMYPAFNKNYFNYDFNIDYHNINIFYPIFTLPSNVKFTYIFKKSIINLKLIQNIQQLYSNITFDTFLNSIKIQHNDVIYVFYFIQYINNII